VMSAKRCRPDKEGSVGFVYSVMHMTLCTVHSF